MSFDDISGNFSQGQMIGLGIAFIIIPIIALILRVIAKTLGRGGVTLDDYLLTAGTVFAVACNALQIYAAEYGELGQHEALGADGTPLGDPRFAVYEKSKFAINVIQPVALSTIKAAVLMLYLKIFRTPSFIMACHVMLGVVTAWGISFFFANLFLCYPISPFIEPFYNTPGCYNGVPMWWTGTASDVVVDFIIYVMPIWPVMNLHLPPQQRLGIMAIFALGATVLGISIARMIAYLEVGRSYLKHVDDETYYTSPTFFWNTIELSTAIVCACLPTYRPLWKYFSKPAPTGYQYQQPSNSDKSPHKPLTFGSHGKHRRLDSLTGNENDGLELASLNVEREGTGQKHLAAPDV